MADLSVSDPDLIPYLEQVRDRTSGYYSMAVPLDDGVELSTPETAAGCDWSADWTLSWESQRVRQNIECSLLVHELVIFDCDGVLVDSEAISNEMLARMLTREGLSTTPTEARRDYQGLLLTDILARAEAKLGRELPPGWLAEYEHIRAETFHRDLKPVAGAAEAVQRVKAAGLKVCVASQGASEKTRLTLGLTGLRDLFPPHALFSAHDVSRPKPHPAVFQHAAATMNAKPSACVVIEDTPSGVAAAVAARMRAIGYAADSDERALRNAGAEIIRSLDKLPELLGLSRA